MTFEVKNTGSEPISLSNGSVLAPGEVATFESDVITVGKEVETSLEALWNKLHAFETRVFDHFEGESTPEPAETAGAAQQNLSSGGPK